MDRPRVRVTPTRVALILRRNSDTVARSDAPGPASQARTFNVQTPTGRDGAGLRTVESGRANIETDGPCHVVSRDVYPIAQQGLRVNANDGPYGLRLTWIDYRKVKYFNTHRVANRGRAEQFRVNTETSEVRPRLILGIGGVIRNPNSHSAKTEIAGNRARGHVVARDDKPVFRVSCIGGSCGVVHERHRRHGSGGVGFHFC